MYPEMRINPPPSPENVNAFQNKRDGYLILMGLEQPAESNK